MRLPEEKTSTIFGEITNFLMASYSAGDVEKKWQKKWDSSKLFQVDLKSKKPKYYSLVMFPYPSGDKLHVGHWYNYGPADSYARYIKMQGYNVFQPMGFDAFGLPAENYAIKTGIHPKKSTEKNVEYMIKQLKRIGCMYDWSKSVNTSTPEYYKWTQWLFLQMYKNGLAYRKKATVNYCPSCKTVLANEQVWDGKCERCKSEVKQKDLEQWFWKTTKYSQKLLDGLKKLDWPEKTKLMQENWIGRSEGVNINFPLEGEKDSLTCYTTRPDTIYSVTFVVIAPEHPFVEKFVKGTEREKEVMAMVKTIKSQTDIERTSEGGKDKMGIFLGKYAINPVTKEKIPVYLANFVLTYGTGVVMADAHDQRDFEFARKYKIPLKFVISKDGKPSDPKNAKEAYVEDGILFDSGKFSGMNNREALPKIADFLVKEGFGKKTVNYRLRDWLLSRQRYWGAPIPMVYCDKCGVVPVKEKDLPVILPEKVEYKPKGGAQAPLATSDKFVKTACPECGGKGRREVDTMDTFVCSSWYYLRYLDSGNKKDPWDKDVTSKWMPVDMYIGGPEHACMHLIYARFVMMALHDFGFVKHSEPFQKLVHQGLVTKDGAKMSKSKGNVVSPDAFVEKYGSDVFRMYLMFMGPFTDGGDWSDKGITGIARFVERFWKLVTEKSVFKGDKTELKRMLHKLIKKVGEDISEMHFNTALAAMMEFVNFALKNGVDDETRKTLAKLIAPLAPHLAEECFAKLGGKYSVVESGWPKFDPRLVEDQTIKIGVQVNGKVRGEIEIEKTADQKSAIKLAMENENILKYLKEGKVVKEIYVPGRILGFVVR